MFEKNLEDEAKPRDAAENATPSSPSLPLSRRGLLQGLGGAGALAAAGGLSLGALTRKTATAAEVGPTNGADRRMAAAQLRTDAADAYLAGPLPVQDCNADEATFPDFRAQFSKCLPHNGLGEVGPGAYNALRNALTTGDPADFDAIPLSGVADRKLANPQAALKYEMCGLDGWGTRMRPAPEFTGAEIAAEMGEVYWQALTRDVPFRDYDSDPLVAAATADLNAFSETVGPLDGGQVTPGNLFRGETPGDLVGPYISQFLWLTVPYGPSTIEQRYSPPLAGEDRMTDYGEWLAIQRGAAPSQPLQFDPQPRFIKDNRGLGEWVHGDVVFQGYFNAALIMLSFGADALSPTNPYRDTIANQGNFVSFGAPDILDLVTKAGRLSLTGAWYQKWSVHRRLRPEMFAGRLHNQALGRKKYEINNEIVASDAVGRVLSANGNRLLPMAFPEGSPTHPAYPAGHATIAGACCTVLKAFFDESFEVPAPVEATTDGLALDAWNGAALTLGGEINKLAANISLGRDAAGVHYRSDGIDGIAVGEAQAIGLLADYSRTYNEVFTGYELTRFDGQRIRITNGVVQNI
ncbi:MAG: vanadium-dependent haloperoxidase [Acidobacteriota bacterium]